jgi:hypothetical protein
VFEMSTRQVHDRACNDRVQHLQTRQVFEPTTGGILLRNVPYWQIPKSVRSAFLFGLCDTTHRQRAADPLQTYTKFVSTGFLPVLVGSPLYRAGSWELCALWSWSIPATATATQLCIMR